MYGLNRIFLFFFFFLNFKHISLLEVKVVQNWPQTKAIVCQPSVRGEEKVKIMPLQGGEGGNNRYEPISVMSRSKKVLEYKKCQILGNPPLIVKN